MKELEFLNAEPASIVFFVILTFIANLAFNFLIGIGWRNTVEKEVKLCKEMMSISRDGDLDSSVSAIKESISKRVNSAICRRNKATGIWGQLKYRIPAFAVSTLLCWGSAAASVAANGWSVELVLSYAFVIVLSGIGIQFVCSTIVSSLSDLKRNNQGKASKDGNSCN